MEQAIGQSEKNIIDECTVNQTLHRNTTEEEDDPRTHEKEI